MQIEDKSMISKVIKLAVPSVLEQVLMMVVGVVSTILVGNLGTVELSAVGLINMLIGFFIAVFTAFSTGCTVLIARMIGEENMTQAKQTIRQTWVLGALFSLILSIMLYVFSRQIIHLFFGQAETAVLDAADTYFRITLYSFPLMMINLIISGAMRGAGDTRTPMYIAGIINIVNLVLSLLLIYGVKLGPVSIPGFGLVGAAWIVTFARGLGGILCILALFKLPGKIRLDRSHPFTVNIELLQRMFKVGIPALLEQLIMQGGFLILQSVIAGMGTASIAVYQVCMNINSIAFIPIWGFGIAATTMIGQNLGAQKPDMAEKSGWLTLKVALLCVVVLTAIVFLASDLLIHIYSQDPEVVAMGGIGIRLFCVSQPFLAVLVVFSSSLRGAGDILFVTISTFIGIWVFRIVLTVILGVVFKLGINGVWYAMGVDFLVRSILYTGRFRQGRWKYITV